jgi:hypothetical protein
MEETMQTGNDTIRRRSNGTIDIDFYRQQALSLRAQARTDFFRALNCLVRPAFAIVVLVALPFTAATVQSAASGRSTTMAAAAVVSLR